MRVLLDACVLYPTVLRRLLLGAADLGHFTPLWSERILGEWRRAGRSVSEELQIATGADIALAQARWPDASVKLSGELGDIWLPDPNDIHVLEAAVSGKADVLLTSNLKDFPTRVVSTYGIVRRDPDGFLAEIAEADSEGLSAILEEILSAASQTAGESFTKRGFLKKARLPRLAKRLA